MFVFPLQNLLANHTHDVGRYSASACIAAIKGPKPELVLAFIRKMTRPIQQDLSIWEISLATHMRNSCWASPSLLTGNKVELAPSMDLQSWGIMTAPSVFLLAQSNDSHINRNTRQKPEWTLRLALLDHQQRAREPAGNSAISTYGHHTRFMASSFLPNAAPSWRLTGEVGLISSFS